MKNKLTWLGNYGSKIKMTRDQAVEIFSPGGYDMDYALAIPEIKDQVKKLNAFAVRAELEESGFWNADELRKNEENLKKILWVAACDITSLPASQPAAHD